MLLAGPCLRRAALTPCWPPASELRTDDLAESVHGVPIHCASWCADAQPAFGSTLLDCTHIRDPSRLRCRHRDRHRRRRGERVVTRRLVNVIEVLQNLPGHVPLDHADLGVAVELLIDVGEPLG